MAKRIYPEDPRVTVYDFGDDDLTYVFDGPTGKPYMVARDFDTPDMWILSPASAPSYARRDDALYRQWQARLPRFASVAEAIASILGEPRTGSGQ